MSMTLSFRPGGASMEMADLLQLDAVRCDLKAGSKKHLLQELASRAAEHCGVDERAIFDVL
ncbi:MAG: hypothetical protein AAF684_08650, partial [Pseudomonadota bacterium]